MLILLIFNPFDIASRSGETSRAVWQELFAETYIEASYRDGGDRDGDPPGRRDITVLLLDDADITALTGGGPHDAYTYWDLIDQVRAAADPGGIGEPPPRAIFVDIGLGELAPSGLSAAALVALSDEEKQVCDKGRGANPPSAFRCFLYLTGKLTGHDLWGDDYRCQFNPLAKLKCIMDARKTPIIFADTRVQARDHDPAVVEGYKAIASIGLLSPVHFADPDQYELVNPAGAADREKRDFAVRPAALLYAIHCIGKAKTAGACRPFPVGERAEHPDVPKWASGSWVWQDEFSAPVDVIWGIGNSSAFTEMRDGLTQTSYGNDCRSAAGWWGSAKVIGRKLIDGLNQKTKDGCLYTNSLTYQQMTIGNDNLLQSAFSDKLVLIGLTSVQADDFVDAPVIGRVAGVFLHAMATDNLIVRGDQYPTTSAQIEGLDVRMQDFRNLLALFLTLIPVGLARLHLKFVDRQWPAVAQGRASYWLHRIGIIVILVMVGLLLIILMTGQLRPVPLYYNYAVLTIIIAFEMLRIVGLILRPAIHGLINQYPAFAALYNEAREPSFVMPAANAMEKGNESP
ncbi:MAG: CHASE2 domain-containing protein [Sphingopyxis sp.]|nr:CHASE2 domain-containing protein [Sphingopyxis sp.]